MATAKPYQRIWFHLFRLHESLQLFHADLLQTLAFLSALTKQQHFKLLYKDPRLSRGLYDRSRGARFNHSTQNTLQEQLERKVKQAAVNEVSVQKFSYTHCCSPKEPYTPEQEDLIFACACSSQFDFSDLLYVLNVPPDW